MPAWRADLATRFLRAAFAALGLALVAGPACVDYAPPPPDVIAWLGTSANDAVRASVEGDLTGHGTKDWAGVVHRLLPAAEAKAASDADPDARDDPLGGWQIAVFLQQPDGHHRLAVASPPFSWDCGTSRCWMEQMDIQKQSVFVQRIWQWHGCWDNVMFQFKARTGGWPLVGVNANSDETPYPDDGGPSVSQVTDWNRITGDVIVTRTEGKRPARVKRLRIVVPPVDLSEFGDFSPPRHEKLPGVCN